MTETSIEDASIADAQSPILIAPKRPIFAIFEGGGAKGIAHVGALQAVQDAKLDIIGVAGTSAGALVAVLTAIGLEAGDIMSGTDPDANILAKMSQTPTGLLGKRSWKAFQRLRSRGAVGALGIAIWGAILNIAVAPRLTCTALKIWENLGHFSTSEIIRFIDAAIVARLTAIRNEGNLDKIVPLSDVTFRELADGWPTVMPLKIIATDVDRGAIEIFDAQTTPNVVVAQAVAASISIPLIFQPAAIPSFRPGRFADGGLVSNLPIWSFSEEKLAFERSHFQRPPVPIIGFSLSAAANSESDGFFAYVRSLVGAALDGSQGAARRFLDDVTIIPLTSSLDMLAFDKRWEDYAEAREEARETAARHLRFLLEVRPERIKRELTGICDLTVGHINRVRGGEPPIERVRVNLIRPHGARSLRVMESLHMQEDADDRLLLDRRGRGAAEAFRARGLRIFRLGAKHTNRSREFMTKYERALVRTSVRAVMCVPIFEGRDIWDLDEADRPEPSGILAIDSDLPLAEAFDDPDLKNDLVEQSLILYTAVSLEVVDGEKR